MYRDPRATPRKRRIVCLEWDGRSLRIVEATVGKKGARLEKVLSVLIPADIDLTDAAALGQWLRRVLDEQGVSAKLAVVDVPRNQAILTTLMLPTAVPGELPGMVEFQIAKELPFPLSEAVVDFAVPRNVTEKTAPVLVAAVRNEVLEHFTSIATHAGLKLERVGLRPFASKTAVSRMLSAAMPDRVLFVDVGPTLTEIDVITADSVPFSRAADVFVPGPIGEPRTLKLGPAGEPPATPGDALTLPLFSVEAVVESLVLEVTRSVEAYRARERGQRINHAVIAGSMGVEEALQEALQKRFDFTVELYNPASTFGWTADEGAAAAGFASVLGLVLAHDIDPSFHFDFLHPKRPVSQAEVHLRRAPRWIGWAAAVIVTLALGYWSAIRDDLAAKAALQKQIAELKADRDEKEQFIKLVAQLAAYDDQQICWLDEFYTLAMQLPGNDRFVLNEVRMDGVERKIQIEARFQGKGSDDWELPFDVKKHLEEEFRRPGAVKPRYEVDVQQNTPNPANPKYSLKQSINVFLRDDGVKPGASQKKDAPAGGDGASKDAAGPAGPATESAPPASAPGSKPPGAAPSQDPGKPGETPGNEPGAGAAPEIRKPSLPARPPASSRTTPGTSSTRTAPPTGGVKTDARGRPLTGDASSPPATSKAGAAAPKPENDNAGSREPGAGEDQAGQERPEPDKEKSKDEPAAAAR